MMTVDPLFKETEPTESTEITIDLALTNLDERELSAKNHAVLSNLWGLDGEFDQFVTRWEFGLHAAGRLERAIYQ